MAVILGLTALVIWRTASTSNPPSVQPEFVVKSAENIIQPLPNNEPAIKVVTADQIKTTPDCQAMASSTIGGWDTDWPVPILMYHYIEEPTASTSLTNLYTRPAVFEAHLVALKNDCYQTILASELGRAMMTGRAVPTRSIVLTFDDGYEDMYTNVFPLLKKYNLKATMYIIVNALDTPGYLTREQIKEMSASNQVEIAAHTFNHPDLRKLNYKKDWDEIAGSKKALEHIIGRPVYSFAYPYGFFGQREEEICRQAGYLTCASTYPGEVQTFEQRFSLYRLRPGYRFGFELTYWLQQAGPKL